MAEVLGLLVTDEDIEKVHTYECECFFDVSFRTPNNFVYGKLGRCPLEVNCCIRVIRYWLILLKMDNSRLSYQAYKMLCALDGNGKENWVTTVRQTLFLLGYGFVWLYQGVATEQLFIAQPNQSSIDLYSQECMADLTGSTLLTCIFLKKRLLNMNIPVFGQGEMFSGCPESE